MISQPITHNYRQLKSLIQSQVNCQHKFVSLNHLKLYNFLCMVVTNPFFLSLKEIKRYLTVS